ncbi:MAG: pseudouridine synthase [Eubacteriales bacterium]|nr:pseudouridine synthase [Eubacteriales bacterium]MDD3503221.1 pseudouridine synthase [Eubacteriales bacterium]
MRLDKCLSNSGHGSRSEVRHQIKKGLVSLQGRVITDPAYNVREQDFSQLTVAGKPAQIKLNVHLMMHKPPGLITAMEDKKLPTIAEIIPAKWLNSGLFPVGRLDRDTTGLLILTNDGILCHRLISPRWDIWKTYQVEIDGQVFSAADKTVFQDGIVLEDGLKCMPANLDILTANQANLSIQEGKFHQVKRMMQATGRRVTKLHRLSFGPLTLDEGLLPGDCRELTKREIEILYAAAQLEPKF